MQACNFTLDAGANPPTLLPEEGKVKLHTGEELDINMKVAGAGEEGLELLEWSMIFYSGANPVKGANGDDLRLPLTVPIENTFHAQLNISEHAEIQKDSFVLSAVLKVGEKVLSVQSPDPIIDVTDG